MTKNTVGFAAVAALIALSSGVPSTAFARKADDAKLVHCYGVNSCKGSSDCKTAKNDCRGQNDCKGHGFKELTAQACKARGGRLTEAGA